MKIEDANTIPLRQILSKIGFIEKLTRPEFSLHEFTYDNNQVSKIYIREGNTWSCDDTLDYGNAIDFAVRHLRMSGIGYSRSDALRWLNNMFCQQSFFADVKIKDFTAEDKKFRLIYSEPIYDLALKRYIKSRGIPLAIAEKHLQEVTVRNTETKKRFTALACKNEDSGWYVRNPYIKANIGNMAITFIRGTVSKPPEVHIFRTIFDYMSAIVHNNGNEFEGDAIVLNSPVCLQSSIAYIKGYGYHTVYTWLKNNKQGKLATACYDRFFVTEPGLVHKPMNSVYEPFKKVNTWLIASIAKQ